MEAKLREFRVQNFRSVKDSGWLAVEDTTCFVGTNESGKTNVLVGLWKLKPANEEPIIPLTDYPRKKFVDFEATNGEEVFVEAIFEFSEAIVKRLADTSGWYQELVKTVHIARKYNGDYTYSFPKSSLVEIAPQEIIELLNNARELYQKASVYQKEGESVNKDILDKIDEIRDDINVRGALSKEEVLTVRESVYSFLLQSYKRKTNINSFFNNHVFPSFDKVIQAFDASGIKVNESCQEIILENLPTFVYYSDYGNLDSEIYLPHVIENFGRNDLGEKERAKARSLKVLFEFVRLSPDEILELGAEERPRKVVTLDAYNRPVKEEFEEPSNVDIEKEREQKKRREVLLQSASTKLTTDFEAWWKQGNYNFRFQADGNHFRIWVSDDKRKEPIELEGRSRGLQWFFSFFLVFLVESKDTHSNCILLLDEPGISLHPVAQMDLIRFFNALANDNQLLYTTHSPFLVETNSLSSIKAMYIGDDGSSIVSSDLRSNEKIAEKSIYPIHAAIGLSVSDTLLLGCQPVLLEGTSDQIYLQLIKKFVLSMGKYKNDKELVFIPTGGVKGMSPVIKILLGRENDLPYVLLDSDKPGKDKEKQLQGELYREETEKILTADQFLGEGAWEIEDLMPTGELARVFAKIYRRQTTDDDFDYTYNKTQPIVDQMQNFAKDNGYTLEKGWKVELAREFQRSFDKIQDQVTEELQKQWFALFNTITN